VRAAPNRTGSTMKGPEKKIIRCAMYVKNIHLHACIHFCTTTNITYKCVCIQRAKDMHRNKPLYGGRNVLHNSPLPHPVAHCAVLGRVGHSLRVRGLGSKSARVLKPPQGSVSYAMGDLCCLHPVVLLRTRALFPPRPRTRSEWVHDQVRSARASMICRGYCIACVLD